MKLLILLLAISLHHEVHTEEIVPKMLQFDLKVPEEYAEEVNRFARNVDTQFLEMPLDHFDPQNNQTFLMRYMTNSEFFTTPGSPILLMIGGEWDISTGWLLTGNMYETAKENSGYLVYTEHRYYGLTLPFSEFTAETLKWLTVDQALADLAYFIKQMKSQPQFADSKVVMFGGSYAANMAVWFKKKYPHLVEGVLASSGPLLGKVDYHEYLETVHNAFESEGGDYCINRIREGIQETLTALQTIDGIIRLQSSYRLCYPPVVNDKYEMGYFAGFITWSFSGSVQTARPGTIINICNTFFSPETAGTAMDQIGNYIATTSGLGVDGCWLVSYPNLLASYSRTSNSKAWYYQTCTEFAFFQIAPSSGTVFDPFLPFLDVDFYASVCREVFDQSYDEQFIRAAVDAANIKYGGIEPSVKNTINVHGTIDPWSALGVLEDISEDSPTSVVQRASHCFDLQPWLPTDTPRMTAAQQFVRRLIGTWLS